MSGTVPATRPGTTGTGGPGRLVAVDVARGLAILGMFVAHLGDDTPDGGRDPAWFVVADGRSAALFALLAGVSLALANGRRTPPRGHELLRARLAALVRAGVLLVLGVVLVALGTPILVILPTYAVLFAVAAPVLGAGRGVLVSLAALSALLGPLVVAVTTTPGRSAPSPLAGLLGTADPVELPMDVVLTGPYPVLVYASYLLAGLAVGRSDLGRPATAAALATGGTVLAVGAWTTSRLLLDALGPDAEPLPLRLAGAAAHDDSVLEALGNIGTALAALGLLLLLTHPGRPAGRAVARLLAPVAATGAMPLTVYSVHIVVIAVLGPDVVWYPESNAVLVWFVLVALIGSWLWRATLGRGPLERMVGSAVDGVAGRPDRR